MPCPIERQHGHDDPRLALAHVELINRPRLVRALLHQMVGDPVLQGADLELALDLKHKPLGELRGGPCAINLELLRVWGWKRLCKNTKQFV